MKSFSLCLPSLLIILGFIGGSWHQSAQADQFLTFRDWFSGQSFRSSNGSCSMAVEIKQDLAGFGDSFNAGYKNLKVTVVNSSGKIVFNLEEGNAQLVKKTLDEGTFQVGENILTVRMNKINRQQLDFIQIDQKSFWGTKSISCNR